MKSSWATKRSLPDRPAAVTATFPVLLSGGLSVLSATIPEGGRGHTVNAEMLLPSPPILKTQACCPKALDLSPAHSQGLAWRTAYSRYWAGSWIRMQQLPLQASFSALFSSQCLLLGKCPQDGGGLGDPLFCLLLLYSLLTHFLKVLWEHLIRNLFSSSPF